VIRRGLTHGSLHPAIQFILVKRDGVTDSPSFACLPQDQRKGCRSEQARAERSRALPKHGTARQLGGLTLGLSPVDLDQQALIASDT
jgi:hypothetical protein